MGALRPQAPDQGRNAPGLPLGDITYMGVLYAHRLSRRECESQGLLAQESRENP